MDDKGVKVDGKGVKVDVNGAELDGKAVSGAAEETVPAMPTLFPTHATHVHQHTYR